MPEPYNEIWTIGHSNRTLEVFLELLASQSIESVTDVRRFDGSRNWPHFGQDPLKASLRGWRARDIMSRTQTKDRELTDFAEVEGERITYP